jgi:hypothetical protein
MKNIVMVLQTDKDAIVHYDMVNYYCGIIYSLYF